MFSSEIVAYLLSTVFMDDPFDVVGFVLQAACQDGFNCFS
jgi:hypothetical protein